jgi:hypothetical protein
MRQLFKFVAGGLVVLVLLVVVAVLYLDRLVEVSIERGASSALGVETTLQSVRLGLLSGKAQISGLTVGNPSGFQTPHFLGLERAECRVELGSLTRGPIVVPLVSLRGVTVNLEQSGRKSNYGSILETLQSGAEDGETSEATASEEARGLVIGELTIEGVTAHVEASVAGRKLREVDVEVADIRLRNIGSSSDAGSSMAEIVGLVTKAILKSVTESGGSLPGNVVSELRGELRSAGGLSLDASGAKIEFGQASGGESKGELEDAARQVGDTVKGIRGLLGRDKKDD